MRGALIVVCIAAGVAHADDAAAVDAAIHGAFDAAAAGSGSQPGWYERLAGAKLVAPSGMSIEGKADLERELADCPIEDVVWKLGTVTRGIDAKRGFAWFQAPAEVEVSCQTAGFAAATAHDTLRASGILVVDHAKWRLVALALSRALPDAALFKGATGSPASDEPTLDDSAAAAGAKAWFVKGGFARNAASDAVASGTDSREYAVGAGAVRLATAWDRLGLRADSIEATVFAGGTVALVRAAVPLPVKQKAAPMTLYAIAILDGTVWRWVSLQFTSELALPPHAVMPDTSGIECPNGKC